MNGNNLIQRVRLLLRDVGYDNNNAVTSNYTSTIAGRYWQDYEILLALNAAQDYYVDAFLSVKDKEALSFLVVRGTYQPNWNLDLQTPNLLPADYLYYVNGTVGPIDGLRIARIYCGADCLAYMNVRHDAIFIYNKGVIYSYGGRLNQGGVLNYYKKPSVIIDGTIENSFSDIIYYDNIVRYASVILGTKEISNQRDYKNWKHSVTKGIKTPMENTMTGGLNG